MFYINLLTFLCAVLLLKSGFLLQIKEVIPPNDSDGDAPSWGCKIPAKGHWDHRTTRELLLIHKPVLIYPICKGPNPKIFQAVKGTRTLQLDRCPTVMGALSREKNPQQQAGDWASKAAAWTVVCIHLQP